MTGDHHGQSARRATLLVRAVDAILGTHTDVVALMRKNITQEVAGAVFGVSQATVSRRWDLLRPLIGQVLHDCVPHPAEIGLAVNLGAALIAALGVWRNGRWGWFLGTVIVSVAAGLYMVQQTVGLPELPKKWWEPSRIV